MRIDCTRGTVCFCVCALKKTADADVATVEKGASDDVGTDVFLTLGVVRKLVGYPHIGRPVLGCIEADTKLKVCFAAFAEFLRSTAPKKISSLNFFSYVRNFSAFFSD